MNKTSLVLVFALVGCVGQELDVGSDNGGLNDASTGGSGSGSGSGGTSGNNDALHADDPIPNWAALGTCPTTGEPQPALVGTWEGALEDFYLDPVVPIRLVITQATTAGVCGTLTWGVGRTPPLPLTDPEQSGREYGLGGSPGYIMHDGTDYKILAGAARDGVLRISVSALEPWNDYCQEQHELSYDGPGERWRCMEPYSSMELTEASDTCTITTNHGRLVYPLKQCAACGFDVCTCNASECAAASYTTLDYDLSLDTSSDGPVLVSGPLSAQQAIRLVRVP